MVRVEDLNITFFHIAKNAGSSIEEWLVRNCNGDAYIDEFRHNSPQRLYNLFDDFGWSFCVIRNPWDRAVSWYRFFVRQKAITCSFERYLLESYIHPRPKGRKYLIPASDQLKFTTAVRYVIRYENLIEDFKEVQRRTKCDVPLFKVNVSNVKNEKYVDYYKDKKYIKLVGDYCKKEIDEFGYKFGG